MTPQTELKGLSGSVKLQEKGLKNCHVWFFCLYICINAFERRNEY